jgi:hypothetical protein
MVFKTLDIKQGRTVLPERQETGKMTPFSQLTSLRASRTENRKVGLRQNLVDTKLKEGAQNQRSKGSLSRMKMKT